MKAIAALFLLFPCIVLADDDGFTSSGTGLDAPKTLRTAIDGTFLGKPGRDTFYLCEQVVPNNGTLFRLPLTISSVDSDWVNGTTIAVADIPTVPGNITMEHEFEITVTKNYRRMRGNGIPNHPIGEYPIEEASEAYSIYSMQPAQDEPNAAAIPTEPYELDIVVPRNPRPNDEPSCIVGLVIGVVAQTGAVWHMELAIDLYNQGVDPSAALPTDECWGHPYATQYHYHGYSWKCFPDQGKPGEHSPLFGYALDGFGIFGPRSEGGKLVTNAELDECHGHVHEIEWDGARRVMYHYHTNREYPYTVGCFRGTPVLINRTADGQVSVNTDAMDAEFHDAADDREDPFPTEPLDDEEFSEEEALPARAHPDISVTPSGGSADVAAEPPSTASG